MKGNEKGGKNTYSSNATKMHICIKKKKKKYRFSPETATTWGFLLRRNFFRFSMSWSCSDVILLNYFKNYSVFQVVKNYYSLQFWVFHLFLPFLLPPCVPPFQEVRKPEEVHHFSFAVNQSTEYRCVSVEMHTHVKHSQNYIMGTSLA